MIGVAPLVDSTQSIGDAEALRSRFEEDGVLFVREVIDPELMGWAQEKYRDALAAEGLIDPANPSPVWTGKSTTTWRPCDAIGTTVWHVLDAEPVWIPIAAHRSGSPVSEFEMQSA